MCLARPPRITRELRCHVHEQLHSSLRQSRAVESGFGIGLVLLYHETFTVHPRSEPWFSACWARAELMSPKLHVCCAWGWQENQQRVSSNSISHWRQAIQYCSYTVYLYNTVVACVLSDVRQRCGLRSLRDAYYGKWMELQGFSYLDISLTRKPSLQLSTNAWGPDKRVLHVV